MQLLTNNLLGSITAAKTSGWQNYVEVNTTTFGSIASGYHQIYILYNGQGSNLKSVSMSGSKTPTTSETTKFAKTNVFASNKTIQATFEGNAKVQLFSVSGQLIDQTTTNESYAKEVEKGIYILAVNGKFFKVIVK